MTKEFKVEILDIEKLIKTNGIEEVTNPVFFEKENVPTIDGLLSNELFGISKDDRSHKYAYIDLSDYFLHPFIYKQWSAMDKNIKHIVYGTKKFVINNKGYFVEDENGDTGISFLKRNINNIKISSTGKTRRDVKIKLLEENKDKLFIKKYLVIPAYYRDVNSTGSKGIGVGEINKLYSKLLISVRSLKESSDYGILMGNSVKARIQELLVAIYDWFVSEPNLSGKRGITRRSVMSKTTDYASRLVISSPDIDSEDYNDLMVNIDTSAVPLASITANMFPLVMFNLRRFFENELASGQYPVKDKNGEITYHNIKDFHEAFSDDKLKKHIDNYIKSYSNRFEPIEIVLDNGKTVNMKFKGYHVDPKHVDDPGTNKIMVDRPLTWLDVIYIAAKEATEDKHILITRYPLEDSFGQFPTKIDISTTKKTEPIIIGNKLYKFYPYIRKEDIGRDTSSMFIDTLRMSNLHLKSIGGDYDGDQVTIKGVYSIQSNDELDKFMDKKHHYLAVNGINIRVSSNEAVQALYSFTKVLDSKELKNPKFN